MGSDKWSYTSPNMGYKHISIVTLLITLLITTHEPPSYHYQETLTPKP